MHLRRLLRSARLYSQKLDTLIINDVLLFLRDKKSLVLVALTPFLILSILINIFYFSDVAENIRGVEFGICNLDQSDFKFESAIFKTTIFRNNCESLVADKVAKGKFRGAIIIPEGFEKNIREGEGAELELFVDNSKSTTAVVTSNAVKAYVSDLNEKIGTEFILNAWKNLKELNENLRFLVKNLKKAEPVAVELQKRIQDINLDLAGIDFAAEQQNIDELIAYLDLLDAELGSVESSMPAVRANLSTIPDFEFSSNSSIVLDEYWFNTGFYRDEFCNSSDPFYALSDPVCSLLKQTDAVVTSVENNSEIENYQQILSNNLAELNNVIIRLNNTISRLAALSDSSSEKNIEVRERISTLKQNLILLDERTSRIRTSVIELNQSLSTFLTELVQVTDELEKTIIILDEYTAKDPESILRPVSVDTTYVFEDKLEIFYRLPALMSILLLFITLFISSSLIVNERKGGTMARIFLSPISMFFYVFEKMLYLLLLCIISVLSMLIATLVFRVPLNVNPEIILVFAVASLVYISVGIFIGAISKSETTSLLTCLVFGFPLMFLSGAFSPPELMGSFIRYISQYLPLTINISLLEKITIYNTGIDFQGLIVLVIMVLVFYILSVLIIRSRPTLK